MKNIALPLNFFRQPRLISICRKPTKKLINSRTVSTPHITKRPAHLHTLQKVNGQQRAPSTFPKISKQSPSAIDNDQFWGPEIRYTKLFNFAELRLLNETRWFSCWCMLKAEDSGCVQSCSLRWTMNLRSCAKALVVDTLSNRFSVATVFAYEIMQSPPIMVIISGYFYYSLNADKQTEPAPRRRSN